ncbi:MAG: DUF6279 family lipoprotein [Gammaproteobacteria bacterium]|nr:DUF6279 family lipoprotein [Gammaproteobacteria bacterium]
MRIPRVAIVVASAVLLVACSRTELFYRNADWLAYRWVDAMLDAGSDQERQWAAVFERLLITHRRELLPDVVALLDSVSRQADRGFTATRVECLWRSTDRLIDAHARLLVPAAVEVLGGVSAQQVAHLRDALAERNAEYRDDYLDADPQRRQTARVARYTERIERWTGELTTAQARLVEAAVRQMPDVADDWLDYRERQQQRLVAMLSAATDAETIAGFLSDWWVERRDRDARLVEDGIRLRNAWLGLIVDLDATLSRQQRAEFKGRIDDLRDDLAGELGRGWERAALPNLDAECARAL